MSDPNFKMEVAVCSERGLRDDNQDWLSWKRIPWGELFIVADGMGGYKGGAEASKKTVEGIERHLSSLPHDQPFESVLRQAVQRTNEEVYREGHSGNPDLENMGSTVVVVLVSDGKVQVGHIGDSRAYLVRKGRLKGLTRDHTSVQRMLDAAIITAEEARCHPDAHILSRAVGSRPDVEIEIGQPVPLKAGDALLLCTDGLTSYVQDKQIEKTLRTRRDVQRIPNDLAKLALTNGGDDNITVQFVRFGGGTASVFWWFPQGNFGRSVALATVSFGILAAVLLTPPTGSDSGSPGAESAILIDGPAADRLESVTRANRPAATSPIQTEDRSTAPATETRSNSTAAVQPTTPLPTAPPDRLPAVTRSSSAPLEIRILMRTERNRSQANFLKTEIERLPELKQGRVSVIGPKAIAGLKPEAWIYYPNADVDDEARQLAAHLKALKKNKVGLKLDDIDRRRALFQNRKELQTFVEGTISPGRRRYLLIVLP